MDKNGRVPIENSSIYIYIYMCIFIYLFVCGLFEMIRKLMTIFVYVHVVDIM